MNAYQALFILGSEYFADTAELSPGLTDEEQTPVGENIAVFLLTLFCFGKVEEDTGKWGKKMIYA